MYEIAKKARDDMKSKAKRIAAGEPGAKVDSSSYTPPSDALNAGVKTGMRPVSRRAYKAGGKVEGEKCVPNMGRKPRKAGGRTEKADGTPAVDRYVNRDQKKANEYRDGIKHVGGMKKGGRAKRAEGGDAIADMILRDDMPMPTMDKMPLTREQAGIKPGLSEAERKANAAAFDAEQRKAQRNMPQNRKSGGRTKKMMGGPMMGNPMGGNPMMGGGPMMGSDPRASMVKDRAMEFSGQGSMIPGLKKGGKAVKHPDEAMDKALIK